MFGSLPTGDGPPVARLFQEYAATIFAYPRLRIETREEAEDPLDVFLTVDELFKR